MAKSVPHYTLVYTAWLVLALAVFVGLLLALNAVFGSVLSQTIQSVLGAIAVASPCYAVGLSFVKNEHRKPSIGKGAALALLFALVSLLIFIGIFVAIDLIDTGGLSTVKFILSGFDGPLHILMLAAAYCGVMAVPNGLFLWLGSRRAFKRLNASFEDTFS
jgi:hypothetical protein